jgi:DNA processing protein
MRDDLFSGKRQDQSVEDAIDWLRLIRSRRVGPTTFWRMLAEHGSAGAALKALPEVARSAGVPDYTPCPEGVVRAEMRAARAAGARLITGAMPGYPAGLRDLPDAPPVLWVMGDAGLLARPMVAIVGARNASSLGTRMARRLAIGLVEAGYVVVSGLARGIDGAAHEAALLSGATVAVQAGGVDVIYPPENAGLAAEIAARGLRLSEQPPGVQPLARHFPLRNRLISGLARAVIVVEAAARSGSLITAKDALDQGREVLAVPGHPVDARATGCNMLIRDGATLVRGPEDVIEMLGKADRTQADPRPKATPQPGALREGPAPRPARPNPPERAAPQTAALHRQILDRLGPSPLAEDQLIRDLALPAAEIAPQLLELELEGRIQRQAGGLLARLN